jgi:hypothetical protein
VSQSDEFKIATPREPICLLPPVTVFVNREWLATVVIYNYLALPKIDCRLPIADCRLPIADCRLPIAAPDTRRIANIIGQKMAISP